MNEQEARLVDLELRFMKLERFTQELSDVVVGQRREIDALTIEAKRLRARLEEEGGGASDDPRPPHY
jgi:uncharacterized coiled-coil protein SlyX